MRRRILHIYHMGILIPILLFSCTADTGTDIPELPMQAEKVRVEIFARARSYGLPTTRASEWWVGRDPWILVFKGADQATAKYVESAATFRFTGIDKLYVNLTMQADPCYVLIIANPQNHFYIDGYYTPVEFSSANFDTYFNGRELQDVCNMLLMEPLSVNVATNSTPLPFTGNQLTPMSYLLALPGGIDETTKIEEADGSTIKLQRGLAKIVFESASWSNFALTGIVAINNVPIYGEWHKDTEDIRDNSATLTNYRVDDVYSECILDETKIEHLTDPNGDRLTTEKNPVYLFESNADTEDMYAIVRGTYQGQVYYYKMAFVNNENNPTGAPLKLQRNNQYKFSIGNVIGRGYDTVQDAIASKPSNKDLNIVLTVMDENAYEMVSNNDYYLGISNSLFIAYYDPSADTDAYNNFDAFTFVTNCDIDFPDARTLTIANKWGEENEPPYDPSIKFANPDGTVNNAREIEMPIVIPGTTTDPVISTIKINMSVWTGEGADRIGLKLGNLEKSVYVRRYPSIGPEESLVSVRPYSWMGWGDSEYFSSGEVVDEFGSSAKNWIKLRPKKTIIKDDDSTEDVIIYDRPGTDKLTVDNGKLAIQVTANTGPERRGTVYLTTRGAPFDLLNQTSIRIKVVIVQRAMGS